MLLQRRVPDGPLLWFHGRAIAAVAVAAAAAVSSGCGDGDGGSEGVRPPGPPVSRDVPPAVAAVFPKTEDGRPILIESHASLGPGGSLRLVYDANRDDAIARWGQCLSQVLACYRASRGPIAPCVDLIPSCSDDSGGPGCCAPACLARFKAKLAEGMEEEAAVDASFVKGDCLQGFAAPRDAWQPEGRAGGEAGGGER